MVMRVYHRAAARREANRSGAPGPAAPGIGGARDRRRKTEKGYMPMCWNPCSVYCGADGKGFGWGEGA